MVLIEQENNNLDVSQYKRRGLWARHVDNIVSLAKKADDRHDLLVEALGALGNLTQYDLPRATTWKDLVDDHDLCGFLARLLTPGLRGTTSCWRWSMSYQQWPPTKGLVVS